MTKRILLLVSLSIVAVILSALWYTRADAPVAMPEGDMVVLSGPDGHTVTVPVEVADTPDERQAGLMNRTDLPDGTGMLFVFESRQQLSFWMKNTLIPLDIMFFDDDGSFVSRASMEPCSADPCPLTHAADDALYALEVHQGEAVTADVGPEWTLTFKK